MKIERTHDKFYLGEDYKNNPKEYYKFVANEIKENGFTTDSKFSLLDIGCETGSFLAHARRIFPQAKLTGIDVMPELLEQVNTVENVEAILGDIQNENISQKVQQHDIVTMLGVLSIFDDYEKVLNNVLSLVKQGGGRVHFWYFQPI